MKVVKFVQMNCTPCKMADLFLSQQLKVEVDETVVLNESKENNERAKALGIMSTPTIIAFDDAGNEVERVSGVGQNKLTNFFKAVGRI